MINHVNSLFFFCQIVSKFVFSWHILVKMSPIFNYTKIIERSQVIPCERTENDGRSVTGKLRVAARDLKNAPKMTKELYISIPR